MRMFLFFIFFIISFNTEANIEFFQFSDKFNLSSLSCSVVISSLHNDDNNINVQFVDEINFIITNGQHNSSGLISLVASTMKFAPTSNFCKLDILDGPYMYPVIQADCTGLMKYAGISYNGRSSYSINFTCNSDES